MTHLAMILAPLMEQASGQGPGPGGCAGGASGQMLVMMGLVFAIFYFLIIRPSQKREKTRQAMLAALKPGDTVVTGGGILGTITGTADKHVVVEISPKVRVRVLRTQIAGLEETREAQASGSSKKPKGGGQKGDKGKARKAADEPAGDDESRKSGADESSS